jgi:hypothetical protein
MVIVRLYSGDGTYFYTVQLQRTCNSTGTFTNTAAPYITVLSYRSMIVVLRYSYRYRIILPVRYSYGSTTAV